MGLITAGNDRNINRTEDPCRQPDLRHPKSPFLTTQVFCRTHLTPVASGTSIRQRHLPACADQSRIPLSAEPETRKRDCASGRFSKGQEGREKRSTVTPVTVPWVKNWYYLALGALPTKTSLSKYGYRTRKVAEVLCSQRKKLKSRPQKAMTKKKTLYPQLKAIDFMQTMRLGRRTKGRNTQSQRYCLNRAVASIVEDEKKSNRNANLVEER